MEVREDWFERLVVGSREINRMKEEIGLVMGMLTKSILVADLKLRHATFREGVPGREGVLLGLEGVRGIRIGDCVQTLGGHWSLYSRVEPCGKVIITYNISMAGFSSLTLLIYSPLTKVKSLPYKYVERVYKAMPKLVDHVLKHYPMAADSLQPFIDASKGRGRF